MVMQGILNIFVHVVLWSVVPFLF